MENSNYYENQLELITNKDEYASLIKVKGSTAGETKWMSLNRQSAKTLIDWLTENYLGEPEYIRGDPE